MKTQVWRCKGERFQISWYGCGLIGGARDLKVFFRGKEYQPRFHQGEYNEPSWSTKYALWSYWVLEVMALSFVTWFFGLEISVNLQISLQILWKLILRGLQFCQWSGRWKKIWKMEEDRQKYTGFYKWRWYWRIQKCPSLPYSVEEFSLLKDLMYFFFWESVSYCSQSDMKREDWFRLKL